MRFSFNWLKKHLDTNLSLSQIAEHLTNIGLEVEKLIDPNEIFKKFLIVKIQKAEKHPNADRLKVCNVIDAEDRTFQIVCGAPNAREGLITILALPGAIIPASNEILKKSKIRGIESQGMMCSCEELSLKIENSIDGIIELPINTPLTMSVGDALNFDGGIIDVSITPNRGDCFSVLGIARDLAASGAGTFIDHPVHSVKSSFAFPIVIGKDNSLELFENIPVMAFRVIRNIKNIESPDWLKSLLKSAEANTISSVVDISNFCMLDIGTPFQIYDLDKIEGEMKIRFAKRNETFTDFSDKIYKLQDNMIVSEDATHEPLCLLGIKSGKKIACDKNTKNILIEAAVFNPINIAKTGIALDANSDSRTRFERGVDKTSSQKALEIISRLIIDTCGGEASDIYKLNDTIYQPSIIELTQQKLQSISGSYISLEKAKSILLSLGLNLIDENKESVKFSVPSWRYDLNIEEDLIEEILRINGYDNVKEIPLRSYIINEDKLLKQKDKLSNLRKVLAFRNMSEVISYSFTKKEYAEVFQNHNKLIYIINAISSDLGVMRPSLLPNLLKTASQSINYSDKSVSIFEIGNIFINDCEQYTHISGLRIGNANSRNWLNKERKFDVFNIKSDLFAALNFYGVNEKNIKIETNTPEYYHPSRSGSIFLGKKLIGYFGELHPKINKMFDISDRIECFELFIEGIENNKTKAKEYLSRVFPKIERDFSFVFNTNDNIGNIVNEIYKLDAKITKVDIFDLFKINTTQKSIGITVVLDAVTRTLTEIEANEVSDKIIKYIEKSGGKLRI